MKSPYITLLTLLAGFALLIVGALLALPGIPGPGIPILLLGLLLLSDRFAWARKALTWLREKTAGIRWPAACSNNSDVKGRRS